MVLLNCGRFQKRYCWIKLNKGFFCRAGHASLITFSLKRALESNKSKSHFLSQLNITGPNSEARISKVQVNIKVRGGKRLSGLCTPPVYDSFTKNRFQWLMSFLWHRYVRPLWPQTTGANRSLEPQARAGSRCTAQAHHVGRARLGGLQPGNLGASTPTQMDYNTAEWRKESCGPHGLCQAVKGKQHNYSKDLEESLKYQHESQFRWWFYFMWSRITIKYSIKWNLIKMLFWWWFMHVMFW